VNWTVLQNSPNTLAFVVPTEAKGFKNSPFPTLWFPMALAEKLAGEEINSVNEADIVATFNAGRPDWYLGTDQQTPSNLFDLTSVALHEIGHGLGFTGTFRVNSSNQGIYGVNDGNAKIYDQFITNGFNEPLLNSQLFPNGSFELASQLTGNSLIFKSEVAKALNAGGSFPRIYAPSPYSGGSSISHLDEGTYSGTINGLMTPFASRGIAEFNPGPLVKGMFYEMGWLNTWLSHEAIGDQESLTGKKFILHIKSDTTLQDQSVKMKYSYDSFVTENELVMTYNSASDFFETEIVNPIQESTISYYFESKDILGRIYRYPMNTDQFESFYLGVDQVNPTIAHTPPGEIIQFEPTLEIVASASDNIGIQQVILAYQINDGAVTEVEMTGTNQGEYLAVLDLLSLNLQQGDQIKYTITAIDQSSNSNITKFPNLGFSIVSVKSFETREVYFSALDTEQKEFFGDFSISKPVGFTSGAIHSLHPYLKSEEVAGISKSYVLLYPIKLKSEDSFLEFDEVVLIEPGVGSDYTLPEFGDYVIVEGSSDDGQTWQPLIPGYDSRKFAEWLNYYNSNINNGDSRAIGTLNYYKRNQINLLNTFPAGTEIFIRFRLFSDNKNAGWGWAIDNLKIQDIVLGAEDVISLEDLAGIYPNPTNGIFSLKINEGIVPSEIKVYNLTGQYLKDLDPRDELHDVSDLPPGILRIRISNSDGTTFSVRLVKY
jgi:hypothetical protein